MLEYTTKYNIGDILQIEKTGALFLIENIAGYLYHFRVLDTDSLREDSIYYIDSHKGIKRIA